jgi:DNA-binding response OmpR family regulator
MTLSAMVVSRDWQEIGVLECILSGLHMQVSIEGEPASALEKLSHSKIDALIVDCDLNGTSQLFGHLEAASEQGNSVPLVIMGERQRMAGIKQSGAMFSFQKPISVEQAMRTLSAARCMILDGRLRQDRVGVEIPISLKAKNRTVTDAHLINISQNGMQIHSDQPIDAETLQISCEIPGAGSALDAQAQVVWHDDDGNIGVRFVKVPRQHQKALQLWLAQQFLTN